MAWIRSQDKKRLIDAHSLYCEIQVHYHWEELPGCKKRIEDPPTWAINANCQYFGTPDGEDFYQDFLGDFLTEEAALAELDAIERWMADGAQGVYQVSQ